LNTFYDKSWIPFIEYIFIWQICPKVFRIIFLSTLPTGIIRGFECNQYRYTTAMINTPYKVYAIDHKNMKMINFLTNQTLLIQIGGDNSRVFKNKHWHVYRIQLICWYCTESKIRRLTSMESIYRSTIRHRNTGFIYYDFTYCDLKSYNYYFLTTYAHFIHKLSK